MKIKMQKIVLFLAYLFSGLSAYCQPDVDDYVYSSVAGIAKRNIVEYTFELRPTQTDTFRLIWKGNTLYDAACSILKNVYDSRDYPTGANSHIYKDSFLYTNGKLSNFISFYDNRLVSN